MANPTYQSGFYAPGRGTAKHPELWRGCVGAWNPGLGNTGLVLRDWSGNQNNGVLTNGPTWESSQGKYAINFDGVNDYVDIPNTINYIFGVKNFSISVWIKALEAAKGKIRTIVAKEYNPTGWWIQTDTSGEVIFGMGGNITVRGTDDVFNDQWHQVTLVRTGLGTNQCQLYIDGRFNAQGTDNTNDTTTTAPRIGSFPGLGGREWKGQITDTRIYNRALSPNEIRTLAQRPGIAYERAPRKFYSLPAAAASSRQYRLFRPSILRGA